MTNVVAFLLSAGLIATVLWEAFETIVLPRSVRRRFRLARLYFRGVWKPWRRLAAHIENEPRRDYFLAVFGPLSLFGLMALWAIGLIVGFAGLHWAAGSSLRPVHSEVRFLDDLYLSGTTLTTLGLGDLQPVGGIARLLTVAEAG